MTKHRGERIETAHAPTRDRGAHGVPFDREPNYRTRRDFLKESGLGAVALSLGALGCADRPGAEREASPEPGIAPSPARKPVVAVIGGGPAGLSAAFHLTRDDGWNDRYDVTVYQMGWRLGGKGATGRNSDDGFGWRIEEHGIHGFCRFYFNTWQMMKDVYGELAAKYPDELEKLPAKQIADAFLPSSVVYPVEFRGRWNAETEYFPIMPGSPWDGGGPDSSFIGVMSGALRAAKLRGRHDPSIADELSIPKTDATIDRILAEAEKLHAMDPHIEADPDRLAKLLREWKDELEAVSGEWRGMLATSPAPAVRSRKLTLVDFYLTLFLGLARERLKRLVRGEPWEIDDLDGIDYRDWLEANGASDQTLSSAITYSVANILFAYPDGNSTIPPTLSTASWLSWVARSLLGRGDYFYFMLAGTGETVILPLYLLLKKRGVRFEFFEKLVSVRTADDGGQEQNLEALIFERQVQLADEGEYEPLAKVPGRDVQVWPHRPRYDQLSNPEKYQGVDFEAWGAVDPESTWEAQRGHQFDYVVWAIPPSMISLVGDDGMLKVWSNVKDLETTATQAAQIWLTKDTKDLGWSRAHLRPETARYASASFPHPLNGCVAFDDLIGQEAWREDGPRGLIYLCSQIQGLGQGRDEALIRVRSAVIASLRVMGNFLTRGRPDPPDRVDEQALDFGLLYDPVREHVGEERLDHQYMRVNVRPTEAYVQAPPGTLARRLDAWESGFGNLVIAGDWIRTGFNLGSFESAVTGGKLAAFALTGGPGIETVLGYRFMHERAQKRIEEALARGPRMTG